MNEFIEQDRNKHKPHILILTCAKPFSIKVLMTHLSSPQIMDPHCIVHEMNSILFRSFNKHIKFGNV